MFEMTISRKDLERRHGRWERLWFAPASEDGDLYWAAEWTDEGRKGDDVLLASASDLYEFAPETGERTLRFARLTVYDTDYWASKTWLDDSVDIVFVTEFARWPFVRIFGPLQHSVLRRQFGTGTEVLSCLPGGMWRLVSEDGHAECASAWCGAAGLMA